VGYPILHLDRLGRDTHRLLREIENALIEACAAWGLEARTVAGRTGVWVGEDKLASIGVAVRRWVSYHGFALNVSPDLSDFSLMHPCGLHGISMTSLARLLGDRAPGLDQTRTVVTQALARRLGYEACVAATIEDVTAAAA
jgi:lipoate-protein ligase B